MNSLVYLFSLASAASFTVNVGQNGRNEFNPSTLTVNPGDRVTFRFNTDRQHNIIEADGPNSCAPNREMDFIFPRQGLATNGQTFEYIVENEPGETIHFYSQNQCEMGMMGRLSIMGRTGTGASTLATGTTRPNSATKTCLSFLGLVDFLQAVNKVPLHHAEI